MSAVNINRIQGLLAAASAYSLPDEIEAAAARRKRLDRKRDVAVSRGAKRYWRAERKARKWKATRYAVKATIERRRERWASGQWGSGERRYRSMSEVLGAHEALRAAFEAKSTLDKRDVAAACGERYWRSDTRWAIDNGLCTVGKTKSNGIYGHSFWRVFTRTEKAWCIWQPYERMRRAYESLEVATHEYLG